MSVSATLQDETIKTHEYIRKMPTTDRMLGAETPKLGEWLQQISRTILEISVQKNPVLGIAKIPCRTLKFPGLW